MNFVNCDLKGGDGMDCLFDLQREDTRKVDYFYMNVASLKAITQDHCKFD